MTPLRSHIYQELENGTTYSMMELANKYRTSEDVIKIQLDKLKAEGKRIKVSDDEVSIFLDHTRPIWVILPYIFMGFIIALMLGGYIHG